LPPRSDTTRNKLDDAARAGWLYYVAGNTQDEIAAKLGVSRQSAQRLVSLAISEKLIKVRLDHPIADCLELGARLKDRFSLRFVEIVPSDPGHPDSTLGVADATALEIEKILSSPDPIVMGIGTGRTLKAAVEMLPAMDCPQHKIVSLTGNIAPDGSAAYYNVIFSIADKVKAPSFPMPLPVIAVSERDKHLLHSQVGIEKNLLLAAEASVWFVGVGDLGPNAPLYEDGFVTKAELKALQKAGAVGEMIGWVFDSKGEFVSGMTNDRVASAPLPTGEKTLIVAAARGANKVEAMRAALGRGLINGLITDEDTARNLLA
jgi:DNA-binding transcriptional regulator LsrR (DeoR family)